MHIVESRVLGSHTRAANQGIFRVKMGASFNGRDHPHAYVSEKQPNLRCSLQTIMGPRRVF